MPSPGGRSPGGVAQPHPRRGPVVQVGATPGGGDGERRRQLDPAGRGERGEPGRAVESAGVGGVEVEHHQTRRAGGDADAESRACVPAARRRAPRVKDVAEHFDVSVSTAARSASPAWLRQCRRSGSTVCRSPPDEPAARRRAGRTGRPAWFGVESEPVNDIPESFADIGELPWPIAGDYLLSEDSDWWMVACLDWSSDAWSTYANGYRKAAGLIVEHITASQTDQDFLVWPFALCWRHYVELRLKRLNILLTELLQKAPPNKKTYS